MKKLDAFIKFVSDNKHEVIRYVSFVGTLIFLSYEVLSTNVVTVYEEPKKEETKENKPTPETNVKPDNVIELSKYRQVYRR